MVVLASAGCSVETDREAAVPRSPSAASVPPSLEPTPAVTYRPASAAGPAENVPLPLMPEEAKVQSKQGLIAFARYWYEVASYAYETGDVEPLKEISGPDCTACRGAYSTLEVWYEGNGWTGGGQINVTSVASEYALTDEGQRQVLVMFRQVPINVYSSEGPTRTVGEGDGYVQLMDAVFVEGRWTALDVVTIKQIP